MRIGVDRPVVFFDGVCLLCNASVDWLFRRDSLHLFVVAPLQGETAREELPRSLTEEGNSVVLVDAEGIHTESDAVIGILAELGPWWLTVSKVLSAIPRSIRDAAYHMIARNRYQWFGVRNSCRAPTPSERARFLP